VSAFKITAADVEAPEPGIADLAAMWGPPEFSAPGQCLEGCGFAVRLVAHPHPPPPGAREAAMLRSLAESQFKLAQALRKALGIPDDPKPRKAAVHPIN